MKSLKSVLVILSAVLLMCFILTSCDATKMLVEESTPVPTTVEIVPYTTEEVVVDDDVDDEEDSEEEADSSGNKDTNAILKAIAKSDSFKSNVKKANKTAKSKLKASAKVDGNTLIYKYKYKNHYYYIIKC